MIAKSMIGQCFHSIEQGQVKWQGEVIGNPEPGWYLVQLFEWATGTPNVRRLVRLDGMATWLFYQDDEMMDYSYKHGVAREGGPYREGKQR